MNQLNRFKSILAVVFLMKFLSELQKFRHRDPANSPHRLEHRLRDVAVEANDRDGLRPLPVIAPPERKGGDVDAEFAEGGAHLPDHAGFVGVAQIKDGALKVRFEGNSI